MNKITNAKALESKRIVIDVDGTICKNKDDGVSYIDAEPNIEIIQQLRRYKEMGFTIVLYTSRQMRTHECNLGRIIATTVPVLVEWLKANEVPYDEIHVGKPWCGLEGFYVDDKSLRPDEFLSMSYEEVKTLLSIGKRAI